MVDPDLRPGQVIFDTVDEDAAERGDHTARAPSPIDSPVCPERYERQTQQGGSQYAGPQPSAARRRRFDIGSHRHLPFSVID